MDRLGKRGELVEPWPTRDGAGDRDMRRPASSTPSTLRREGASRGAAAACAPLRRGTTWISMPPRWRISALGNDRPKRPPETIRRATWPSTIWVTFSRRAMPGPRRCRSCAGQPHRRPPPSRSARPEQRRDRWLGALSAWRSLADRSIVSAVQGALSPVASWLGARDDRSDTSSGPTQASNRSEAAQGPSIAFWRR